MRRSCTILAAVIGGGAVLAAGGQQFRSTADAVRVDALVVDGRRPVAGLSAGDFELRDSGVVQDISDIQVLDVPFSMLLVLDSSSSMQHGMPRLKEAARAAVEALHPDDRASVMTFTEELSRPTPWLGSRDAVFAAIGRLYADGATGLSDAAVAAMLQRDPEPGRRNLVILFTDGSDTSSWLPEDSAFDYAERSDVVVYGVAIDPPTPAARRPLEFRSGIQLSPRQPVIRSEDFLRELAGRTGGERVSTNIDGLQKTFRRIVDDFRSRYVLSYTPRGVSAAGWHSIEVHVKGKNYKITSRRGYQR